MPSTAITRASRPAKSGAKTRGDVDEPEADTLAGLHRERRAPGSVHRDDIPPPTVMGEVVARVELGKICPLESSSQSSNTQVAPTDGGRGEPRGAHQPSCSSSAARRLA